MIFAVLTMCGHRHVSFPAGTKNLTTKRPPWLYRGFASYEQAEWLHNTHLVKRILCLPSLSESVGRLWLYQKKMLTHQKAVCGNMPLPLPATVLFKKAKTTPGKKQQHGGVAALLSASKLSGCVSHAKRQESTTRQQL